MFCLPDHIQFNSELSSTLKTYLRALAHHCGEKNVCWPSQKRVAEFMNCSIRTVKRCERLALELQFIEVKRRWLKSNVYKVLCLEERKPSTMGPQERPIEQTNSLKNQRSNGSKSTAWKNPQEIGLLLADMQETFGQEVTERNRGWFIKIARTLKDEWIYESLSWLRQAIFEAECSETEIKSPSALFTWRLRTCGASI